MWNKERPEFAIGIDSGVNTGIAIWNCSTGQFVDIKTTMIHRAMETVRQYAVSHKIRVIVEDARKATYGRNTETDYHKAQGAGSVKRDGKIWEDFLTDLKVPFEMKRPVKSKTKLSKESFQIITKYKGITSNHSRDAALLVYGM